MKKILWGAVAVGVVMGGVAAGAYWYQNVFAKSVVTAARPAAGLWERVDPSTLRLYGPIMAGSYQGSFRPVFDANVKTVLLDSGGGDVDAALSIATDLHAAGVHVFVERWCLSSCANYLFLAGRTKSIGQRGVVGFHGDFTAVATGLGDHFGLSDADIAAHPDLLERTGAQVAALRDREQAFLQAVGVDQDFFDRAAADDKGSGDGSVYSFLAPGPQLFAEIGLDDINGTQSAAEIDFLARYGVTFRTTD